MEQKKLKDEISRGELGKLYLLYGEERFLVQYYATEIAKGHHKDTFEGAVPAHEIMIAADTIPFSPGKRLIYVKDSNLFTAPRKADAEEIANYLEKIPDDTTIVFIESEVDKRGRLFKKIVKMNADVYCETPAPPAMTKWIIRTMKEKGKIISDGNANTLQRTCGTNMANLFTEMDKLAHYLGNKTDVSSADIKDICTPTLEARIFDLVKAMGAGNASSALNHYRNMLFLKESPFVILSMIIRQLRIILLCKVASEKNLPRPQIAKDLNIRDFVISEALTQGKRFTKDELITALKNCQDTDTKIKTGLLSPEIGVEVLLAGLSVLNVQKIFTRMIVLYL
ncbi:MAG: DNA polymerase III subunit delta [Defluviitaleaceae bacterium]|nr:DNA polymerase III subunit delta [Defluviitaleaceae bacterium]